jgi:hypothetical protein
MLATYEAHYQRLFQDHPFQASARSQRVVEDILNNETIKDIFEFP